MITKFKLAKGWTKKKVLARVKKFNNGTRAVVTNADGSDTTQCLYQAGNGNRCAIGAFIPFKGGITLDYVGGVESLLEHYPALAKHMPFTEHDALREFQSAHDNAPNGDVYKSVEAFLKQKVE